MTEPMKTADKLTELFKKHNPEFRFDPQVSHKWLVNAFESYVSEEVAAERERIKKILYNRYFEDSDVQLIDSL